ncbi:MAG: ribonuclease P protein component [Propionibacteriales bacterium]|nr:ribonuclease P protein component [Propionibacteriales bacterium]
MLPVASRLQRRPDFQRAVRTGRRVTSSTVVAHRLVDPVAARCQVGFVVSRSVGSAVVRNTVKRRLRALMRDRLTELTPGLLVLRATPRAGQASFATLGDDVDNCLRALERRTR